MRAFTWVAASLVGTIFFFLGAAEEEVLFRSLESRNIQGKPVHNKIRLISDGNRDIWMMNQSHHGGDAPAHQWDRLAIVVDRKNDTAKFFQLPPGDLVWSDELPEKKLAERVSCTMCHANGPRAIRPVGPTSMLDRVRVLSWNIRIHGYGRLTQERKVSTSPSRDLLKVGTCLRCHREEGFFSRGTLTREHTMTIGFLVENGFMPPAGYSLTEAERREIRDFVEGF